MFIVRNVDATKFKNSNKKNYNFAVQKICEFSQIIWSYTPQNNTGTGESTNPPHLLVGMFGSNIKNIKI